MDWYGFCYIIIENYRETRERECMVYVCVCTGRPRSIIRRTYVMNDRHINVTIILVFAFSLAGGRACCKVESAGGSASRARSAHKSYVICSGCHGCFYTILCRTRGSRLVINSIKFSDANMCRQLNNSFVNIWDKIETGAFMCILHCFSVCIIYDDHSHVNHSHFTCICKLLFSNCLLNSV